MKRSKILNFGAYSFQNIITVTFLRHYTYVWVRSSRHCIRVRPAHRLGRRTVTAVAVALTWTSVVSRFPAFEFRARTGKATTPLRSKSSGGRSFPGWPFLNASNYRPGACEQDGGGEAVAGTRKCDAADTVTDVTAERWPATSTAERLEKQRHPTVGRSDIIKYILILHDKGDQSVSNRHRSSCTMV